MSDTVLKTDIKEFPLFARGKVRDVYDMDDKLLIVSTDRLSAFDVILPDGIPGKGKVLTAMSLFWFDLLKNTVKSHLITGNVDKMPSELHKYIDILEGRTMLVNKADRIDIECIVRGYISGSMWKELLRARKEGKNEVHGFPFAPDLRESDKLPNPIFTPSTKADDGHDENLTFEQMIGRVGKSDAEKIRELSIALYEKAREYADEKGVIIADTKFEFGKDEKGDIVLIDEIFTPDSSRFWKVEEYTRSHSRGKEPPAFDKQFVRNYLSQSSWDKNSPPPELPYEVIAKTREKYVEIYEILTGNRL